MSFTTAPENLNCLGTNLIKRSGRPRWQKPETRTWEVTRDLSEGGDLVLGGQSRRRRVSFLSPLTWTSCSVPATIPAGSFVEMKEPMLTFLWKGQRCRPDITILKRRDKAGGIPRVQSRGNGACAGFAEGRARRSAGRRRRPRRCGQLIATGARRHPVGEGQCDVHTQKH